MIPALLADSPMEVTPTVVGLVVIVLLELSQFFFAWKKDQRASEGVRKEDLTNLKTEIMDEIEKTNDELGEIKKSFEGKLEAMRLESQRTREVMYRKINTTAETVSGIKASVENVQQTQSAQTAKIDNFLLRAAQHRSH